MAKIDDEVSKKIELCAKKEFLEKGYVDASLRTIAAEAMTTTGSIYSRYGGKEGLFSALVEPSANEFVGIFRSIQEKFCKIDPRKQAESMDEYTANGMKQLVEYIYSHLEEFHLLVDSSYGTKFQNFVEHLVEIETEYTYKFIKVIGIEFKKSITKDFMHIMNKALFESFFEIVRHNMSKEEAVAYAIMLETYHSAGWEIIYKENC